MGARNAEFDTPWTASIRSGANSATDGGCVARLRSAFCGRVRSLTLIAAQEKTRKPIVASSYADTLGVPALFDRSCFRRLLALPDDSGAKSLIAARPDDVATVLFEEGAIDIDTPEDFQRLR